MSNNPLQTPVQFVKGVGPKFAKTLERLGIFTVNDLLYFFPRDYEDRTLVKPIASLTKEDDRVLIRGEITGVEDVHGRAGGSVLKVVITDFSGSVRAVFFNQKYLLKVFRRGIKLFLSGKMDYNPYENKYQFIPRSFEFDNGEPLGIVPIYNLTDGIFQKSIRKIVKTAIDSYLDFIEEPLPANVVAKFKLISSKEAILKLHFPPSLEEVSHARNRIAFEEFFIFQLGLATKRSFVKSENGIAFNTDKTLIADFPLPFKLTGAQERVLADIFADMASSKPMSRLVQGDVGSGKTVVAVMAAYMAIKNGYQAAILAPTEILAQQHYAVMTRFIASLPYTVQLVTGNTQKKSKVSDITADLVVGTHALI